MSSEPAPSSSRDRLQEQAHPSRAELLGDRELRKAIERFVRGRVPMSEVDDVVQSVFVEALAALGAPEEPEQFRKWLYGVARHKCFDHFRRTRREGPRLEPLSDEIPGDAPDDSAREWLRWAERELPKGENSPNTLEWMLREADGEPLETIAEEEKVPAPRVRQRVVRLRQHFRSRWAAQLAAIVAILALAITAAVLWRRSEVPVAKEIAPEPVEPTVKRARELRRLALENCRKGDWGPCLKGLDTARDLDAQGESLPEVRSAREAAGRALAPAPTPVPAPVPTPTLNKTLEAPVVPPLPQKSVPSNSSARPPIQKQKFSAPSFEDSMNDSMKPTPAKRVPAPPPAKPAPPRKTEATSLDFSQKQKK